MNSNERIYVITVSTQFIGSDCTHLVKCNKDEVDSIADDLCYSNFEQFYSIEEHYPSIDEIVYEHSCDESEAEDIIRDMVISDGDIEIEEYDPEKHHSDDLEYMEWHDVEDDDLTNYSNIIKMQNRGNQIDEILND